MISSVRRAQLTKQAEDFRRNLHVAKSYLEDRGISMDAAQMFGLGYATDGPHTGRLAVPYWTPAGVVDIKMRCTSAHDCKAADCPKYLPIQPALGQHLYNAQVLIHAAEIAVVTEGELDAVCVQAYCGLPAVAYPGTESWNAHRQWRMCCEGVSEVVVVADGDGVGHKAAAKVAESIGMSARVVDMPEHMDGNSFIQQRGANAFLELIQR